MDSIKLMNEKPIYIIEGPFDCDLGTKLVLLCAAPILILGRLVGAIIFTFMIMNLATEKSLNRIDKTIDRGDKVVIWPTSVVEKDINDMVLGGHNIMSVLESNTHTLVYKQK